MRLNVAAVGCVVLLGAASSPSFADSPREFLNKAVRGDNSEIMLGNLASRRAASSGVRDYGEMLKRDHKDAKREVLAVGRRLGMRATTEVMPEAREEERKLSRLRGRDFDQEFVSYMVDDHRKDIDDFRSESHENHGAVSQLAERQLPTLEKHLQTAESLQHTGGRDTDRGRRDSTNRQDGN